MKKEEREVYIADDGKEFNSEKECLAWENRKFRKSCKHLSNEEIIKLLSIIHPLENEKYLDIVEKIELQDENLEDEGFEYRITIKSNYKNCQIGATITGENNFRIFPNESSVVNKCEDNYQFWFNDILGFFNKVGYYKDLEKEPKQNPDITREWSTIYESEIVLSN